MRQPNGSTFRRILWCIALSRLAACKVSRRRAIPCIRKQFDPSSARRRDSIHAKRKIFCKLLKLVVPDLFATVDRSMLDSSTAAREYSDGCYFWTTEMKLPVWCARNSASMARIDQSHPQKARGVTTSVHFVISRPGTNLSGVWGPLV